MASRLATDTEVETWRDHGWVLLEGLVGAEEIDDVADDLHRLFPTAEEYHADPEGVTRKWKGSLPDVEEDLFWGGDGPGFRHEQHRWMAPFPFPGSGTLSRLCVHPSIADFAERALGTPDIRLYQAHATAAFSGVTNYEQPMHIDRNHSWIPAGSEAPWWNLEGFLYLADATDADKPTRMVSVRDSAHVRWTTPIVMPDRDARLYESEHRATGVRGSYLAYRSDVFHRGGPFGAAERARFMLALAFKRAGQDWIGYDQAQSRSTDREWTTFRRTLDAAPARAVRVPATGSSDLGRGVAAPDRPPLSEARSRALANRAGLRVGTQQHRIPPGPGSLVGRRRCAGGRRPVYSAAMAASTSSLAARRAGQVAAPSPSSGREHQEHHQAGERDDHVGDALLLQRGGEGGAEGGPDDDPDDGAEDRQDHRLGPDHGPHLAPLHPDRPQQADLVGALEHRQHEGVDDPDEGDEDGQGQQGVDQAEQLVDLGLLRLLELRPGSGSSGWDRPMSPR